MSFDPRSVEAQLALGRIHPENMPALAWDALEAGYDGPAVCRMAAFVRPTGFEVDEVLPAFLRETGMTLPAISEAAARVAYDMARDVIDCRKDPFDYAKQFEDLWISTDYQPMLNDLGTMPDEIYISRTYSNKHEDEVRADMRDGLILFIRKFEAEKTEAVAAPPTNTPTASEIATSKSTPE